MMRYALVIEEAAKEPTKRRIEFRAKTEARAYRFVIDHVINDERNAPLIQIRLDRQDGNNWKFCGRWRRGPGWIDNHNSSGLIDRQSDRR